MIEIKGDLFLSSSLALGHGVNCVGVMGAGIAPKFRSLSEEMYQKYRSHCKDGSLVPGMTYAYLLDDGRWVYNMATQDKPGRYARLEWVYKSARKALVHADRNGVESISIPKIGCGIGGLDWADVQKVLQNAEKDRSSLFVVHSL